MFLLLAAAFASAQNISISSSTGLGITAYPRALIIQGSGQQNITFTNNSTSTVNITFQPNPVYPASVVLNNIANLAPNGTNTQTPQVANGSVNYYVTVGRTQYGPYAIQVGSGPLYVQISYDSISGTVVSVPETAVVPVGGTLEMDSTDFTYGVSWSNEDPFTPALNSVGVGTTNNSPVQLTAPEGTYPANFSMPGNTGPGGGRVIIQNS